MSVGKDEDYAPVGRKRRSWTRDEKRRIVEESLEQGASIAEVARRHELNANLLFTWRRKIGVESSEQNGSMEIVPVTITPESAAERHCSGAVGQMEIVLAEGERIIVWSDVETTALSRVLEALARR
jgi:transposase